jgi:hypothetical protein
MGNLRMGVNRASTASGVIFGFANQSFEFASASALSLVSKSAIDFMNACVSGVSNSSFGN